MIRSKGQVIPLLEYYAEKDEKEKQEQLKIDNINELHQSNEEIEKITMDALKGWIMNMLKQYKSIDFSEINKKYASFYGFGYSYKFALHRACLAQDIHTTKALTLALDKPIQEKILSGKLRIDWEKKYRNKDVLETLLDSDGDENINALKFIFLFGSPPVIPEKYLDIARTSSKCSEIYEFIKFFISHQERIYEYVKLIQTIVFSSWNKREQMVDILERYFLKEKLNEKYLEESPKGTPFIVACETGQLHDVKFFIENRNIEHEFEKVYEESIENNKVVEPNLEKVQKPPPITVEEYVNQKGKDTCGMDGYTPLVIASKFEQLEILRYLLREHKSYIRIGLSDSDGRNVLHIAAHDNRNSTETVSQLLRHASLQEINKLSNCGFTPLDHVYDCNHHKIKEELIQLLRNNGGKTMHGLKIERLQATYLKHFPKCTPFVAACELGDIDNVVCFVEFYNDRAKNPGYDNAVNKVGCDSVGAKYNGLMKAAECGNESVVKLLLEDAAVTTDITNDDGLNALHYAAKNKSNANIVRMLLDHSTSGLITVINKMSCDMHDYGTPLNFAYRSSANTYVKTNIIYTLRKFGAAKRLELLVSDLVFKYKNKFEHGTPFCCACETGNIEDVKCFVANHLDTDNNNDGSLKFYLNQPGKDTSGKLTKPGIFLLHTMTTKMSFNTYFLSAHT